MYTLKEIKGEDPFRYVLVYPLMTMCVTRRIDVVVYDKANGMCTLIKSASHFLNEQICLYDFKIDKDEWAIIFDALDKCLINNGMYYKEHRRIRIDIKVLK